MEKRLLDWQVGYADMENGQPREWYPAVVPGNVQMDYARAHHWPPLEQGLNCREYRWMEDKWWVYTAPLNFSLEPGQIAALRFVGIDYQYEICVDGERIWEGTGMFSPIRCDVTRFAGRQAELTVRIWPAPKCDDSECRDQARKSVKPCVPYGWDYHPRIVPLGIWDEAYLEITDKHSIHTLDAAYRLSDDLSTCRVEATLGLTGEGAVRVALLDGETIVAEACQDYTQGVSTLTLTVDDPQLWYPAGYGEQKLYTLQAQTLRDGKMVSERTRHMGFRRAKMVMNEGSWSQPDQFPKGRSDAPATLEINGRRIFAKGSNWVNAQIFHGDMNRNHYGKLLELVRNAHMNILRMHGGGPINKECFYELCDEMGIMVWQEFPLACNEYPDEDEYLAVLKQDATAIIKRLRTHPSLVLWCGGNELFNSWSRMTEQHHALRLLGSLCYEYDRFTPFNMTSPLYGMSHGHYLNFDETTGCEFISVLRESRSTAYTEFGSPGMEDAEYLRTIMSEEDFADCRAENPVWTEHHGFGAWTQASWIRKPEVEYYFGGFSDTADLCEKTRFIQAMGYRSLFEEMRKQWPHCAMALNWCFNEPWPTAANNSLISWPARPKPAYYAVQQALRDQMASLRIDRHLWQDGEVFHAGVWMLNDGIQSLPAGVITAWYALENGEYVKWGSVNYPALAAQRNCCCGEMAFVLPEGFEGRIRIRLTVEGQTGMDSEYTYLCRAKQSKAQRKMLNFG